jgi:hypothetical protein
VWCALQRIGTYGPVFIEDTVNSQILHNDFVTFLMGYVVDIDKAWFQQHGARPHTAGIVLDYFKETLLSNLFTLMVEVFSAHHCHRI